MKTAGPEGESLEIEDLDLSGIGLYLEKDVDVSDPNVFLTTYTSLGRALYAKKSDQGKKWQVYDSTKLKPWSEFVKKAPK